MEKPLQELARLVGGTVVGDGQTRISRITNIENPGDGALVFANEEKHLDKIRGKPFAAVLVPPAISAFEKPLVQCSNPKLAWAVLLGLFHPLRRFEPGISEKASVHPTARIGKDVTIESFVTVGANAEIGRGTVIRSGSTIDRNVVIGEECRIHPHVTLYEGSSLANRVILHSGVVVGSDGFGYVFDGRSQFKVPQVGNVIIEDDVELGANVTVDRATIGSTIIRRGAKIDNLVQIAHNSDFGEHSIACAQVGISGSSVIGKYVTLAGQVGLGDHCEIGDQVTIGAQAGLPTGKKVPPKSMFLGSPARPLADMKKQFAAQLRAHETLEVVRNLAKRVEALEQQKP